MPPKLLCGVFLIHRLPNASFFHVSNFYFTRECDHSVYPSPSLLDRVSITSHRWCLVHTNCMSDGSHIVQYIATPTSGSKCDRKRVAPVCQTHVDSRNIIN
ncbi:hypothetical protein XELAEV_18035023mg [Xenopus laevis]|uniref:Uncharacterized protein n=1 Tax=Xenopus laevis TaxID=8355 RepID=A0A974CEX7_XENLA|nr:hypothetical protein XELAEV_18035023mg [Xenopus laevis]